MMNSKICLLLTDDPDDQQSFSNAIAEIAPDNILITVIDPAQALKLLSSKKISPDIIFADVSMYGMDLSKFRNENNSDAIAKAPFAVYGYEEDSRTGQSFSDYPFLSKDCTYSDLVNYLKKVLKQ